ncbi:MAG TPA: PAS domain-containing protein [Rhizomicrobium sp.]|nr:PAS domain-containing protein [Rhizomicrobium sp.]
MNVTTSPSELKRTPDKSSVSAIALSEMEARELLDIYAVWNERRGGRRMPARADVLPAPMGRNIKNVSLISVLGDDYEFRIIGEAHIQAYGARHQGKRLSEVMEFAPGFAGVLKRSVDIVVRKRIPIAYRGAIGRDVGNARFVWIETMFLPLGQRDDAVDHVMTASIYVPRNGIWEQAPTIA